MSDQNNDFLSDEELVQKLVDEGQFYTITWDHNLVRLQRKIAEFFKAGYKVIGDVFVQTEYTNIGTEDKMVMQPLRDKVCVMLFNQDLFQTIKEEE